MGQTDSTPQTNAEHVRAGKYQTAEHQELRKRAETFGLYSTAIGPVAWAVLHCVAANYPHDYHKQSAAAQAAIRQQYRSFLQSFAHVFPCTPCSKHWVPKTLNIDDRHFASRTAFCRYVYDLHNQVTDEVEARKSAQQRDGAFQKTRQQQQHFTTQRPTFEQHLTLFESLRCPPPELRGQRSPVYALVRFQTVHPGNSIQIDERAALNTSHALQNHLLNGGWCPGIDGEPPVE